MLSVDFLAHILDPHVFADTTGQTFRGLSINGSQGGFNVVLRAFTSSGEAIYAITFDDDAQDGLQRLWAAVSGKNAPTMWRKDRFYSNGG